MRQLTFKEVETLLRLYPRMQGLLKSLQIDLQTIELSTGLESEESVIYGMAAGGRKLDGLPHPPEGNTSDKTAKVALSYRKVMDRDKHRTAMEIVHDISIITMWLDKIDSALATLDEKARKIVTDFYIYGKDYAEITFELPMSKVWFFTIKRQAVESIVPIMKTGVDDAYERVLKLCGVKEE